MSLPPRETIRAVLLDLDGTLLDTAPDIAASANRMLARLGRDPLPEPVVVDFIGQGIANLVRRTLAETGTPNSAYDEALALFEEIYLVHVADRTRPYPGVIEGLTQLQSAGIALGCVTNKASRFTQKLLETTGLLGYFGSVVCGDQVARKKPEPDALLAAVAALGVAAHESWVIGDSANDVKAARAAGCPVAVVPYGYREGLTVEALGADAILSGVDRAAGWITMGS